MIVREFTMTEKMFDKLLMTGQMSATVTFESGKVEHIRFVVDESVEQMDVLYEQRDYNPQG